MVALLRRYRSVFALLLSLLLVGMQQEAFRHELTHFRFAPRARNCPILKPTPRASSAHCSPRVPPRSRPTRPFLCKPWYLLHDPAGASRTDSHPALLLPQPRPALAFLTCHRRATPFGGAAISRSRKECNRVSTRFDGQRVRAGLLFAVRSLCGD